MTLKHQLLIYIACLTAVCCNKKNVEEPDIIDKASDTVAIRLKGITIKTQPAPYYHFIYNDSGYIIQASLASGLAIYNLSYTGSRIANMQNTGIANKDRLVYEYSQRDPHIINIADSNGIVYKKCTLTYTPSRQLEKLYWEIKNNAGVFTKEKILEFSYYTDGNLSERVIKYFPADGLPGFIVSEKFESYDDKANVDGFAVLQTAEQHLILLPGTKMQKNNPRRMTQTGLKASLQINYTYSYDPSNRPLVKTGDVTASNGEKFETLTTYSY